MTRRLAPLFIVLLLAPGCKGMGGLASGLGHLAYGVGKVAGATAKVAVRAAPAITNIAIVAAEASTFAPPVVFVVPPPAEQPDDAPIPLAPTGGDDSSAQAAY